MTSVEMTQGGVAASKPVTLKIQMTDGKWYIYDLVYGDYVDINTFMYNNKE